MGVRAAHSHVRGPYMPQMRGGMQPRHLVDVVGAEIRTKQYRQQFKSKTKCHIGVHAM
jgi:hypothetical protein